MLCQMLRNKLWTQSKTLTSAARQHVRNYYKPNQKEAFYDVEGVVTKDVLLFRYDDTGKVFWKNLVALVMFPVGTYLGYTAYTLKATMGEFKDKVAENNKINWRAEQIEMGSVGIGLVYFLFCAGLSSYWITRTMNTVRRLVLRKGGKYVQIQTYGITGGAGKIQNIPVVHCSGEQHPFHRDYDIFFLKVRDHSFKYQLNLKDGVVSNKPLFDRTVGLGRTI